MNPNDNGAQNPYYGGRGGGMPPVGRGGYVPPVAPQQSAYPPAGAGNGQQPGGYYPPQPQQPQQFPGRGGYDGSGGYGGAYIPGPGPAGVPASYGRGGAAGYYAPQQPPQQMYGGGAPYGGQQQMPYMPQQQQQPGRQPRYAYNGGGAYGGGGGGMGYYQGAPGGNYYGGGGYPPQQQQQQYAPRGYGGGRGGNRGGRGRGGGRGGGGGGRNNSVSFVIHLDSFAKLEELGRKGVLDGIVPQEVIFSMTNNARSQPLRALVVVEKQYLGARMTFPRHAGDIILSQATVQEFLDIRAILNEEGEAFVTIPNGAIVPRHLYTKLSSMLTATLPFDKPQPEDAAAEPIDVTQTPVGDLLRDLTSRRAVYDAVRTAVEARTPEAAEFFSSLVRETFAEHTTEQAGDADHDGENDDEGDEGNARADAAARRDGEQQPGSGTAGGSANASVGARRSRKPTLFTSPQGVRILETALADDDKRKAFFDMMAVPAVAADTAASTEEVRPSLSEQLFRNYFSDPITSAHVLESFGLSAVEGGQPVHALRSSEVDAMCNAFAQYGPTVLLGNGGCAMVTTLMRRLCPGYTTHEAFYKQARGAAHSTQGDARGVKRAREDEEDASGSNQQAKQESGPTSATNASGSAAGVPRAPANMEAYHLPTRPLDARFFHAVARAFVSGDVTRMRASQQMRLRRGHHPQQQQQGDKTNGDSAEADGESMEARAKLITEHIIGCRAMQAAIPHFADAVLAVEKNPSSTPAELAFAEDSERILSALSNVVKTLTMNNFGNYVIQTLIIELAPRSVPGTKIETVFQQIQRVIVDNIFDMSIQKFASNCCDRAIVASEGVQDGAGFVNRLAEALLSRGDTMTLQVATHQFGNYVMRNVCERLTRYATTQDANSATDGGATVTQEIQDTAAGLEKKVFLVLSSRQSDLGRTPYGQGINGWIESQRSRLQPAA